MNRTRLTVAELLALKGTRQLSMLHLENLDEARAAAAARIDLLSIETPIWSAPMREAAGDCFVFVGLQYGQLATFDDYVRAAHDAILLGGDAVYCAASLEIVSRLRAEGIPVCGHTGLIPSRRTWTGGFKAVGRTAESAAFVYRQVKELEHAGAFAAEIEVVPARVTAEIAKRTSLLLLSMGGGTGGRRPVPVLGRRARLHARPPAPPRQGVPGLPRRARPVAAGAHRRLLRVRGRRGQRPLPRGAAPRRHPRRRVRRVPGHPRLIAGSTSRQISRT